MALLESVSNVAPAPRANQQAESNQLLLNRADKYIQLFFHGCSFKILCNACLTSPELCIQAASDRVSWLLTINALSYCGASRLL
jgi:hypothetical protein